MGLGHVSRLGISLSYSAGLDAIERVGINTKELLIETFRSNHNIRFIGDNVNIVQKVHTEIANRHDRGQFRDQTDLFLKKIFV